MIVNELAKNVINTTFETFDEITIKNAKNRIIDIVGCIIGGANAGGCNELRNLVLGWGGNEQSSILMHGGKTTAHNAALINTIMGRSFDFGVLIPYIGERMVPAHIAETMVPTAISVAEWKHAGGKELITAMILGDDITTRISAASSFGVMWDTPGTVNKFGATAIAGKLIGLNEKQLVHAFGIVLNQLAGSFQSINDGGHSFKWAQGLASRDGIIAAELAATGWMGCIDPLEGKYAYFSLYCNKYDPEIITKDLGKAFYGDCTFKPYPSCRWIHSTIDCSLEIVKNNEIDTNNIDEIVIDVAPMHFDSPLNQPFELHDFPQGNATFSLRYHVANVLLRRCVELEHLTENFIRDPEIARLANRVTITANIPPEKLEASSVTVKMKNGQELHAYTDVPKGNPLEKPLSKQEIEEKFRGNVAFSKTISNDNAEKVLDMLNHIEDIKDAKELVDLLCEN